MKILIVTGTRPEIIKMSPIIEKCNNDIEIDLIHLDTTQHFDYEMNQQFFEILSLPTPQYSISLSRKDPLTQISSMISETGKVIKELKPHFIMAQGDTNTVMISALVAKQMNIPFGHVEAGIRSFDLNMPEEVNRRITDICTNIHFCPTDLSGINLLYEGIEAQRIFITGNTIVDTVNRIKPLLEKDNSLVKSILRPEYMHSVLVTLHRPSNVDNKEKITEIINSFELMHNFQFILPLHPRTRLNLNRFGLLSKLFEFTNISILKPLGYLDFLSLLINVDLVVTDSGGVQEECLCLKKKCLTLRENTERPETLISGSNQLISVNKVPINEAIRKAVKNTEQILFPDILGKGNTADRIIKITKNNFDKFPFISNSLPNWEDYQFKLETVKREMSVNNFQNETGKRIIVIYNKLGKPIIPYLDFKIEVGSQLVTRG